MIGSSGAGFLEIRLNGRPARPNLLRMVSRLGKFSQITKSFFILNSRTEEHSSGTFNTSRISFKITQEEENH